MTGLSACGESSDDPVAEELARQREIAAARHDAAQGARQAERVKQLTREVRQLKKSRDSETEGPVEPPIEDTPPDSGRDLGDWPGGSAYSAMLGAFSSEENAQARQREATGRGLDAGLLYSSEFSSLTPGYWIVFSGRFSSESEAAAQARRARALGYSDSYPRFVSP